MHTDILQFFYQKGIIFLSVDIVGKLQLPNIMEHSGNRHLITELLVLPQFGSYSIRKITDSNSMIQFLRKIKIQQSVTRLEYFRLSRLRE